MEVVKINRRESPPLRLNQCQVIVAPEDVMLNDHRISRDGVAFVDDICVDKFQLAYHQTTKDYYRGKEEMDMAVAWMRESERERERERAIYDIRDLKFVDR